VKQLEEFLERQMRLAKDGAKRSHPELAMQWDDCRVTLGVAHLDG